jgi:hypothetical protein
VETREVLVAAVALSVAVIVLLVNASVWAQVQPIIDLFSAPRNA